MIGKQLRLFLSAAALLTGLTATACAQAAEYGGAAVEAAGFDAPRRIWDGDRATYSAARDGASVTVSREGGIGSLYIEFDRIPQEWILTDPASGASAACGKNAFLHEFVDVAALFGSLPQSLALEFPPGTVIADLYAFSGGEPPGWVQVWQPPCERADLLLISSHSDDEQLFFAGVLPYYAGERGLSVQVAYIVQHFQAYSQLNHQRPHEQLDGLWTVGVRSYPVMSSFPDLYSESTHRETAFSQAEAVFASAGVGYGDFVGYITECIRRFRPLVVVSHDLDGEYGHGTHVLCAAALTEAIHCAADAGQYPDSAAAYGLWEVEKTYLHLYPEDPIVMDFDLPLEHFGGKTAFEMSQEGFACHKSQHWTWFYRWIYGTSANPIRRASDIKSYSPCLYGLYHTRVGPDLKGGDFFENVETYAQRAQAEAEAARAEAEAEAARARAEAEAARSKAQAEAGSRAEEALVEAAPAQGAEGGGLGPALLLLAACGAALGAFFVLLRRKGPADGSAKR